MHFAFLLKSPGKVPMLFLCYICINKSSTLYISFSTWVFLSRTLTLRAKVEDMLQSQTERLNALSGGHVTEDSFPE